MYVTRETGFGPENTLRTVQRGASVNPASSPKVPWGILLTLPITGQYPSDY